MQQGTCGYGGVLPTAPLMPRPLRLSSREKTSCTALKQHLHSQHSPRVSRIHPAPGSQQCRGPCPCPRCLPHGHPACPPVTQCRTEGSTRGLAAVPRLALDVMACEVLRILQLTDTALVPVSYLVPRKVRGDYRVMGACCRVMGDTSSALGDKGHLGVGAARSPAWEEQERRQNLGAGC